MARPSSVATRLRSLFSGRTLLIGTPFLWLLVFFLLPFLIVLRISLAEMDGAMVSEDDEAPPLPAHGQSPVDRGRDLLQGRLHAHLLKTDHDPAAFDNGCRAAHGA